MSSRTTGRASAAFGVGFAFVVMLVSGLLLILAPKGVTARAIDWQLLGLGREGWEAVHLATSFFFVAFAVWHTLVHWPVLVNFWTGTPMHPAGHRAEGLAMLLLVVALLVTAILNVPPSSWLVDLNEYFKQVYWLPAG